MQTRLSHDLQISLKLYRAWCHMGWQDVKLKYRRSSLGPWWLTISMAVFIAVMATVYTKIFHQNIHTYLPFFASGFLIWSLLAACISESCDIFFSAQSTIKQNPLPNLIYTFRMIWKNLIIFTHNAIVYLCVIFISQAWPNANTLFAIPGFILLAINLSWLCTLIGFLSTRFRDIPPIIMTTLQILFLVSPITWMPTLLGTHSYVLTFNPFYYLLDTIRSPIIGQAPMLKSWIVLIAITTIGWVFTYFIYNKYSRSIALWIG